MAEDFEIVWEGEIVGRLTNVDFETIVWAISGMHMKYEGDFESVGSDKAADFRRQLEGLAALSVTVNGSSATIYSRGDGRAKIAFPPRDMSHFLDQS